MEGLGGLVRPLFLVSGCDRGYPDFLEAGSAPLSSTPSAGDRSPSPRFPGASSEEAFEARADSRSLGSPNVRIPKGFRK